MIKVLVIDDEPMQRQGIVRLTPWADFGAEVVGAAGSGMEGILLAREHRPDVRSFVRNCMQSTLFSRDMVSLSSLREQFPSVYAPIS